MCTARAHGMDLAIELEGQHLAIGDTFDLAFEFLHGLEIRERGDILKLVFLGGHGACGETAGGVGGVEDELQGRIHRYSYG